MSKTKAWSLILVFLLPLGLRAGAPPTFVWTQAATVAGHESAAYVAWGPDQNIWATEQGIGQILEIDSVEGNVLERFPLPASTVPLQITAGPDGNLWFTALQTGSGGAMVSEIGSCSTQGTISIFPVPDASAFATYNSGPIAGSSDGFVYALDTTDNRVYRVDPVTHSITKIGLVRGLDAGDLTALPTGDIWVVESGQHLLAHLSGGEKISETAIPNAVGPSAISACTLAGGPGICIVDTHGFQSNFIDECTFAGNCVSVPFDANNCSAQRIDCHGSDCFVTTPFCQEIIHLDVSRSPLAGDSIESPIGFNTNQIRISQTPLGLEAALTALDANSNSLVGDSSVFVGVTQKVPCVPPVEVHLPGIINVPIGWQLSEPLNTSDAEPPVAISVMGDLPPGVNLLGDTLAGTLPDPGEFTFTVVVTDDRGCTGTATLTVNVERRRGGIIGTPFTPPAMVGPRP